MSTSSLAQDWSDRTTVERILATVARAERTTPQALEPPLASVVDPDAIDALFDGPATGAVDELRFSYHGHEVVVRGANDVALE